MHIDNLSKLVVRLANREFVRWWAHFNHPEQTPWLMAIAIRGNHPIIEKELIQLGFFVHHKEPNNQIGDLTYFAIERTFDIKV